MIILNGNICNRKKAIWLKKFISMNAVNIKKRKGEVDK